MKTKQIHIYLFFCILSINLSLSLHAARNKDFFVLAKYNKEIFSRNKEIISQNKVLVKENKEIISSPQEDSASVTKEKQKDLWIDINTLSFFQDNEYNGERVKGYTLPGFRLRPTINYKYKNFTLCAGIDALHYWGKEIYPAYSYCGLANVNETDRTQKQAHITPFFRAQADFNNFSFVLGDIYMDNAHNMITPLYSREIALTSDNEAGVQALYNSKHLNVDTWVNWQRFIFAQENKQEVIFIGSSNRVYLLNNRFKLYVPVQFLFNHHGGEFDSTTTLQTIINYSLGLGGKYSFVSEREKENTFFKDICAEFHYVFFKRNTSTGAPYHSGNAFYPTVSSLTSVGKFTLSYWQAKDFISILGNNLFNTVSSVTPSLFYDKVQLFLFQYEYDYLLTQRFIFGADLNFFYFLHSTGHREGYPKIVRDPFNSFSFGFYIKINPTITLH